MHIFGLGTPEIILIVVVLLLFYGKDRLPELAKSIGRSVQELKKGFTEGGEAAAAGTDSTSVAKVKGK